MSVVLNRGERRRRTAKPGRTLFALVTHTIRMQLRGVIIWGAAIGLYGAAMVASFTAIERPSIREASNASASSWALAVARSCS